MSYNNYRELVVSLIKKHLNLILLIVIAAFATLIFNLLKSEGHIKTYSTCVSSIKVDAYNDSKELKAIYYTSRCDDSKKLKNIIYIEDMRNNKTGLRVFEGYSDQPEIYTCSGMSMMAYM